MQIAKGYVYSIGGGLLRYEGIVMHNAKQLFVHRFTVVKPLNNTTREVKPWNKYKVDVSKSARHGICYLFTRDIFKLLKYEQTLTILHGNPS